MFLIDNLNNILTIEKHAIHTYAESIVALQTILLFRY